MSFCQNTSNEKPALSAKDSLKFHLPISNLFIELVGIGYSYSINAEFKLFSIKNNAMSLRLGKGYLFSTSSTNAFLNYNRMISKNINFEGGFGFSYIKGTNGYIMAESFYEEDKDKSICLNLGINFFVLRNLLFKINIYPMYTYSHYYYNNCTYNKIIDEYKDHPSFIAGVSLGYSFRKRLKYIMQPEDYMKHN